MILRLASTFVLALGVAVFANSAFAGNGNGTGNGNGNADGVVPSAAVEGDSSHGKSEAPGQAKKEAEAGQPAPVVASVVVAEETAANSEGVKPSNTTEHETHAAASSDKTKEYGNGKTAGQIAIQNGAAPSAILHGPGNSQPHKVAPCSGRHEVDVHGLKGKGHQKACGTSSPPVGPAPGSTPGGHSSSSSDRKPDSGVPAADPGSTPADPGSSQPAGGVASHSEQGSQGVLAVAAVVGRGTLPFTGFPLWAVALVALMLLGFGLALLRQAGATVAARDR
jgi:hypothetical protein